MSDRRRLLMSGGSAPAFIANENTPINNPILYFYADGGNMVIKDLSDYSGDIVIRNISSTVSNPSTNYADDIKYYNTDTLSKILVDNLKYNYTNTNSISFRGATWSPLEYDNRYGFHNYSYDSNLIINVSDTQFGTATNKLNILRAIGVCSFNDCDFSNVNTLIISRLRNKRAGYTYVPHSFVEGFGYFENCTFGGFTTLSLHMSGSLNLSDISSNTIYNFCNNGSDYDSGCNFKNCSFPDLTTFTAAYNSQYTASLNFEGCSFPKIDGVTFVNTIKNNVLSTSSYTANYSINLYKTTFRSKLSSISFNNTNIYEIHLSPDNFYSSISSFSLSINTTNYSDGSGGKIYLHGDWSNVTFSGTPTINAKYFYYDTDATYNKFKSYLSSSVTPVKFTAW